MQSYSFEGFYLQWCKKHKKVTGERIGLKEFFWVSLSILHFYSVPLFTYNPSGFQFVPKLLNRCSIIHLSALTITTEPNDLHINVILNMFFNVKPIIHYEPMCELIPSWSDPTSFYPVPNNSWLNSLWFHLSHLSTITSKFNFLQMYLIPTILQCFANDPPRGMNVLILNGRN